MKRALILLVSTRSDEREPIELGSITATSLTTARTFSICRTACSMAWRSASVDASPVISTMRL